MNFGLKHPCKSCPFVEAHDFSLTPERIMELRDADHFTCHNTIDYEYESSYEDEDFEGAAPPDRDRSGEQTCMGWLIMQWAQFQGFPSWVGFAASKGIFDPHALPTAEASGCFPTFEAYAEREEERYDAVRSRR